jgi:hypothetical protein
MIVKRTAGWAAISFLLGLVAFTLADAADPKPAPSKPSPSAAAVQSIKGEVVKIEGNVYVVKEATGKEVRLRVNPQTVLQANLQVGDKIDAEMLPDGIAITMLKALQ